MNKPQDILKRLRGNLEERLAHDNEEARELSIMERELEHIKERVEYRRFLKKNRAQEIALLRRDIEKLETETQAMPTVTTAEMTNPKKRRRPISLN